MTRWKNGVQADMSDYIKREDTIAVINNYVGDDSPYAQWLVRKIGQIDAVPRWIPCEERLPKDLEVVNITWVNHRPVGYYFDIKDKPFTATAIHYEDKWWWYSPICEDLLAECGKSECDKMDADIEVTAWMPLPEPYKGERRDDEID